MKFSAQIRCSTIILCSIAILFISANLLSAAAPQNNSTSTKNTSAANAVGKLYVLNVWGTNAEDIGKKLECLENEFNFSMRGCGLTKEKRTSEDKDGFVADYITLDGKNATKQNVISKCTEISQRAQKNDVIFVYMCCHGKMININGDNKRYQVLFPGIERKDQMEKEIEKYGILRSEIISALNPDNHRFVVLITDPCSTYHEEELKVRFITDVFMIIDKRPCRLKVFLQSNTGLADWNSTSPYGRDNGKGEISIIYSRFWERYETKYRGCLYLVLKPIPDLEYIGAIRTFNGTFFDAFDNYAFESIDEKTCITTSDFFNDLSESLKNEYKNWKDSDNFEVSSVFSWLTDKQKEDFMRWKKNNDSKKSAIYKKQKKQTLFDFKGLGYVIDNEKEKNAPQELRCSNIQKR